LLITKNQVNRLPRLQFLSLRLSRAHNHVCRERLKRSEQSSADLNVGLTTRARIFRKVALS
jgi:hypothetical protein